MSINNFEESLDFDQEQLIKMLCNQEYNFPGSPYEPSSDEVIPKELLTFENLADYLGNTYHTCDKPHKHRETINKIIGEDRAKHLIESNKSEYFKVLTHFAILSKTKRGWYNLLVTSPIRNSKPSLSDNPSKLVTKAQKALNDAIIRCFYSRLFEGMTPDHKDQYYQFLPENNFITIFDFLLAKLDSAIFIFFMIALKQIDGYANEAFLPDFGSDEAIDKTRFLLHYIFKENTIEDYRSDSLRASLLKFASINRATNDIDAIINIQEEIANNLPDGLEKLIAVESEPEILPALSKLYNTNQADIPKNLLDCARLVCQLYIINHGEHLKLPKDIKYFEDAHMSPCSLATSSALLYQDFLNKNEINLNIRGDTNKSILVYKTFVDLYRNGNASDKFSKEIIYNDWLHPDLFKYLTTRYSIAVFGLSSAFSCKKGALAHLSVKRKKFELIKEAYELLKNMSVNEACAKIVSFHLHVDEALKI